ncbi:MAG: riboflavin kinase, partial [Clostridia bacterium]|nr:riboflavin kinase [Clostridia bacterium]
PAVANVGARPTVSDGDRVNCETHILDYAGDLYGKFVQVSFLHRLRDEQKFADVYALKERINRDIEETRQYFAAHPQDLTKEDTP